MARLICLAALGALVTAMPAAAQPATDQKAPDTATAPTTPGMVQPNQPVPGSPDLTVATVKMEGGMRASKIVGAAVYNSSNQQVGTVDDLVLNQDGKVMLGVIAVGGFLGVGGKLVAAPFAALHVDASGKVTLPEASKDTLTKMPGFTYVQ